MKRTLFFASGLGALILAAGILVNLTPSRRAEAATFQVNYDQGQDDHDGLSPATAWKHAPGDPEAKGVPARMVLRPGDRVLFAVKVRYRGSVVVTASGTAEAPIVFAGAAPGGQAIIDGSDPVLHLRPCPSAADCGGATGWQKLVRFESPAPLTDDSALFSEAGPLRPAQSPDPKDDFYRDEIADMAEVDGGAMENGRVALPAAVAAGLKSGGGRLALWIQPNRVTYVAIQSIDGVVARFDPAGLKFYTDRPERAAVIDHVSVIDRPGEYVILGDHKTVVAMLPPGASALSVASGRFGIRIRGGSHIVVRDLAFENMGDDGKNAPYGVGVFADGGNKDEISGLRIENNVFRNFVMPEGQGPVIARKVNDLQIIGNRMDTIVLGSGIRLGGPSTNTLIANNDMHRIGRTAIAVLTMNDVVIRGNRITDVRGVHGNGISPYLDNHNVRVIGNTVLNANMPATFEGAGAKATGDNNLLFANNLFVATPDALGALISWGDTVRGVVIRNNVLVGGKAGMRLNSGDINVTISDNISSGLLTSGNSVSGWRLDGNEWTQLTFQQEEAARPPSTSKALAAAARNLSDAKELALVCTVVKRHTVPPAPGADETEGAVGADIRCP